MNLYKQAHQFCQLTLTTLVQQNAIFLNFLIHTVCIACFPFSLAMYRLRQFQACPGGFNEHKCPC